MFEEWEPAYRDAMLETENQKLPDKISFAVAVLESSLSELGSSI